MNEAIEKAKCVRAAHVASHVANHAYLAARKFEIDAFRLIGFVNKGNEAIYEAQQAASYAAEDAERFAGEFFSFVSFFFLFENMHPRPWNIYLPF